MPSVLCHFIYVPKMTTLSDMLKLIREERGLTQSELASHSGISRATIQNVESGKQSPTVETLDALAGALGVPIGTFFGLEAANESPKNTVTASEIADLVRFYGDAQLWQRAWALAFLTKDERYLERPGDLPEPFSRALKLIS